MSDPDAYSSIALALADIGARLGASPSAADEAKLKAAQKELSLALGAIALADYAAAASNVAGAAQKLQKIVDAAGSQAIISVHQALAALTRGGQPPAPPAPEPPAASAPQPLTAPAPQPPAAPAPQPAPAGAADQGRMSEAGFDLLRKWEGCVLFAYDDANSRRVDPGDPIHGTLTIGYGHTGPDVVPGLVWTQAKAEQMLKEEVATFAARIAPLIAGRLTDNQFSAFVCFAFNIGVEGFRGSSALRYANEGKLGEVPGRMAFWHKTTIDGQLVVSQGLINRRAAEGALWNTQQV